MHHITHHCRCLQGKVHKRFARPCSQRVVAGHRAVVGAAVEWRVRDVVAPVQHDAVGRRPGALVTQCRWLLPAAARPEGRAVDGRSQLHGGVDACARMLARERRVLLSTLLLCMLMPTPLILLAHLAFAQRA